MGSLARGVQAGLPENSSEKCLLLSFLVLNLLYSFTEGLQWLFQRKLELSENLSIAPLQCLACSKGPECLRILSGNLILTSIKGHNSLSNLRKMTSNNPNLDLVSIVI